MSEETKNALKLITDQLNALEVNNIKLTAFINNVHKVLKDSNPQFSGEYFQGYYDGIDQVRREIYGK